MNRPPCFECGEPASHDHHVIARVHGGGRTVPLCLDCHCRVHGRTMAHADLTRAGLAAAKLRGVKLGTPANMTPEARRKGADANRTKASRADALVFPIVRALRSEGKGIKAVAAALNDAGYSTEAGRPWTPMRVKRALQRAGLYAITTDPEAEGAQL